MYILAFETSCDDTSVALMKDTTLIAMSTRTQLEHDLTGWVVPEVAARSHANAIFPCIEDVLSEARMTLHDIDVIACTEKPWLLPSLLTGMTVAKTLSLSLGKPLLWIDHIESHIFANYLERDEDAVVFPAVVLTVSWSHTEIYHWKSLFELELMGQSRDDAAGEVFDKVSRMMGLGFPGWAKIAKLASEYEGKIEVWDIRHKAWAMRCQIPDSRFQYQGRLFPQVMLEPDSLDFSFSGIKSAVKREVDARMMRYEACSMTDTIWPMEGQQVTRLNIEDMREIAYEFEETVTNILSKKLLRAIEHTWAHMMLLAGWVSANSKLKAKLQKISEEKKIPFLAPVKNLYSMDNAAMVGIRAYYEIQKMNACTF